MHALQWLVLSCVIPLMGNCASVRANHAYGEVFQKVGSLIATASVAIVVYNDVVNVSGSPLEPIRFHKCLLVTRSQHLPTTHIK